MLSFDDAKGGEEMNVYVNIMGRRMNVMGRKMNVKECYGCQWGRRIKGGEEWEESCECQRMGEELRREFKAKVVRGEKERIYMGELI